MDGRLSSMQNRMRFCNTWENPWRDFSRSYAAMEPRQYRPEGGMSRIGEGRNGGGAGAWAVGLAKEQNGRAIRRSSIKVP